MARELPEELLLEVLLRLPVKSLLRFRCVCKSWNSAITSSKFIIEHASYSRARDHQVLIRCYYQESRDDAYAMYFDNENLDKRMDICSPFRDGYEFYYILDCVDGVVCMTDSYQRTNTVVLWNPMVRKFLTLPKPNYELSCQELMHTAVGFGPDTVRNDFKFVRIYDRDGHSTMDMFKLSTSFWTDVAAATSLPSIRADTGVRLNAVLHWLSYDRLIIGFDLASETFKSMMLPRELEGRDIGSYEMSIVVWCDFLGIVERFGSGKICLWVMKEYGVRESWSKEFVIEGFQEPAGIRTSGELMFYCRSRHIVAYDPVAERTNHGVLQLEGPLLRLQMTPYTETLVLLNDSEDRPAQPTSS